MTTVEGPPPRAARTTRELVGSTLVVTFVRPEARNALDRAMVGELRQVIEDCWTLRPAACVFTGAGPAFCAGGDLKERRAVSREVVRQIRREIVELVGLPLARQVILLGRVLSAAEARDLGLVLSTHPAGDVLKAALGLAKELGRRPRLAVHQARRAMRDAWGYDMSAALKHENDLYDPCIDDQDRDAALERFAARRAPADTATKES